MTISARTILKVLSLTGAFFLLLMFAYITRRELVWIGVAFFLAVALNPAVEHFAKILPRRNRVGAISAVFLILFAALVFMGITLVPPLIAQTEQLAANFPTYAHELATGGSPLSRQVRSLGLARDVQSSQTEILHYATGASGSVFKLAQSVFSSFAAGITILGLTFFMLLEGPAWLDIFWRTVPEHERKHSQHLADQMYAAVTGYVTGNVLSSLLAAVLTAAMLTFIRVPYAVPLGILVGVFDLLPLVGATIGSIVVVLAALFVSTTAAIIMVIFFLVYQQVENHVLKPLIYGKTVKMSPLSILVWVLLGAGFGGIVGAIVAIPVGASVHIVIKDYAFTRAKALR